MEQYEDIIYSVTLGMLELGCLVCVPHSDSAYSMYCHVLVIPSLQILHLGLGYHGYQLRCQGCLKLKITSGAEDS